MPKKIDKRKTELGAVTDSIGRDVQDLVQLRGPILAQITAKQNELDALNAELADLDAEIATAEEAHAQLTLIYNGI